MLMGGGGECLVTDKLRLLTGECCRYVNIHEQDCDVDSPGPAAARPADEQ